jgi:hypothetical protein
MEPVGSGTPSGSVNDLEYQEGGSKGKRPLARDFTKASRNKAMSVTPQVLLRVSTPGLPLFTHYRMKIELGKVYQTWNSRS